MIEDNLELFTPDHEEMGKLFDNIETLSDDELKKAWPKVLANIVDLFVAELVRSKMPTEQAQNYAPKLAAALGHYFGGRSYYIPTGDSLKTALRDNALFYDYQRSNGDITKLAKKYDLTDNRVYNIIREQLALHRKKHQPDMFNQEG